MITLKGLTLRRGTRVVLDDVDLTLHAGEKVALVGRNGAGKSSLFGLLLGELHEDAGDCLRPAGWRLAWVAQDMPDCSDSATDFVIGGDLALSQAVAALAQAEATGDGEAIAHAHMSLQDAGAHDAAARAQALLLGLGFAPAELHAAVNTFSGGWRMRLQLARALMAPSDLLLLDEPTNHLDLDALVWLEAWLRRYEGALLVISHDREFLDAVTEVTVHIEQARLTRYRGNYSQFEDLRAVQITQAQQAYTRQQEKIAHLQHFIDRFKAKATKARQAQSRVKALERMERLAPVLTAADFQFEFREPPSLPNPMLSLRDVAAGYDASAPVLRQIQASVLAGQRIGILGANGQGKSTLVKTITQGLSPLGGRITTGKGLRIGYFAQHELDLLHPDDHPLLALTRLARIQAQADGEAEPREQELRNFLGQFQFAGDAVHQAIGSLSGGEKARLVLCLIVWQRPNLLVLDEPTNHLDLATREALGLALNEFEGSVLLVSHDRALLRAVCDEFWLVSNGGVAPFDSDLDDYQTHLLVVARARRDAWSREGVSGKGESSKTIADSEEFARASGSNESESSVAGGPGVWPGVAGAGGPDASGGAKGAEARKQRAQERAALAARSKPLKDELARVDAQLATLRAEMTTIEAALSAPAPGADMAGLSQRYGKARSELDALEERWLDLAGQIEELAAA